MGGGLYPDGSLSGGGVSVCGRVGKRGGSLSVAGWGRGVGLCLGGSLSGWVSVWGEGSLSMGVFPSFPSLTTVNRMTDTRL